MDNYQLNEEIGKGYFSTAYKGRRRRTINFYAILSTDKCRRMRVLNSVHILRDVQHPSVIKFYNWFETNNHLWVITEYCSGGDLRSVLKKTVMNENSLRVFSRDIAVGIMHFHSLGYLYNDLKPDNLLMDSIPSIRFYNFGNSCPIGLASQRHLVGTPAYMAPELFLPRRGVVSMAADLWSLGCVMYEMATSSTPFVGNDLPSLLKNILTSPAPQIEGASKSLNNLLLGLLEKDPRKRFTWKQVAASDFWEEALPLPAKGFPSEPDYAEYISKPAVAYSDESLHIAVQSAVAAASANITPNSRKSDEMFKTQAVALEELDFTAPAAVVEETIVEKVSGGGSSPGSAQKKAADTSNTNTNGKSGTTQSAIRTSPKGSPSNGTTAAGMNTGTVVGTAAPKDGDQEAKHARQTQLSKAERTNSLGKARDGGGAGGAGTGADGGESSPARVGNPERTGSTEMERYMGSNSKLSALLGTSGSASVKLFDTDGETLWTDSTWIAEVRGCIWHHLDSHIRPLCMNGRIERYTEPTVRKESLPFPFTSFAQLKQMNNEALSNFLPTVYKALCLEKQPEGRINILAYLEVICKEASIANILVNSATLDFCFLHLDPSNNPLELRVAAATIIGQLVRHTTFIHQDTVRAGMVQKTVNLFQKEPHMTVKRRLLVCLGELLFYIAVQTTAEREAWDLNPSAIRELYLSALDGSDEVLRHYAVKGIENVVSVADRYMACKLFTTPAVLQRLTAIFRSPSGGEGSQSKGEHMRSSAICAVCKLGSASDTLLSYVLHSSVFPLAEYPVAIRRSHILLTSQLLLTLIVYGLFRSVEIVRIKKASTAGGAKGGGDSSTVEEENQVAMVVNVSGRVLEGIREMGDKSTLPMRGKCLLLMALLASLGGDAFAQLCNNHTGAFLDRLMEEKDEYVTECLKPFSKAIRRYIVGKLRQHREHIFSPLHLTALRHLLSSSSVRQLVPLDPEAFQYMGECMQKSLQGSSTHSVYEDQLHVALEGFLAPEYVQSQLHLICTSLIPVLQIMIKSPKGSSRFFAVRLLHTFVSSLLIEYPAGTTHPREAQSVLTSAIGNVTEALPELLKEAPPVPSHTFHLLGASGEWDISVLSPLSNTDSLSRILRYISSAQNTEPFFSLQTLQLLLTCKPELIKPTLEAGFLSRLFSLLTQPRRGMENAMDMACGVAAALFPVDMSDELRSAVQHLVQPAELATLLVALMHECLNSRYAATAIEGLVRLSKLTRQALLSRTAGLVTVVLEPLYKEGPVSDQRQEILQTLLRATSYAAKELSAYQTLGQDASLLLVLHNIQVQGWRSEVIAEATKLVRDIDECSTIPYPSLT